MVTEPDTCELAGAVSEEDHAYGTDDVADGCTEGEGAREVDEGAGPGAEEEKEGAQDEAKTQVVVVEDVDHEEVPRDEKDSVE